MAAREVLGVAVCEGRADLSGDSSDAHESDDSPLDPSSDASRRPCRSTHTHSDSCDYFPHTACGQGRCTCCFAATRPVVSLETLSR